MQVLPVLWYWCFYKSSYNYRFASRAYKYDRRYLYCCYRIEKGTFTTSSTKSNLIGKYEETFKGVYIEIYIQSKSTVLELRLMYAPHKYEYGIDLVLVPDRFFICTNGTGKIVS